MDRVREGIRAMRKISRPMTQRSPPRFGMRRDSIAPVVCAGLRVRRVLVAAMEQQM